MAQGGLTFSGVPLHGVLSSHLSELSFEDVGDGGVVDGVVVEDVTPVLLSVSLHAAVESAGVAATAVGRGRRGGGWGTGGGGGSGTATAAVTRAGNTLRVPGVAVLFVMKWSRR